MNLSCLCDAMQHLIEAAASAFENSGYHLDEHRVLFSDGMGLVVILEKEVPRRGSRSAAKEFVVESPLAMASGIRNDVLKHFACDAESSPVGAD